MSRRERIPHESTDCSCVNNTDEDVSLIKCSVCDKITCLKCDPDDIENFYQCSFCETDMCIDCCFGCNFCGDMYCIPCDQQAEDLPSDMCKKCEEQENFYF